jgi:hypothetical protein
MEWSNTKLHILDLKSQFPFGKYKGLKLERIPYDYLVWAQNKLQHYQYSSDIIKSLEKHLADKKARRDMRNIRIERHWGFDDYNYDEWEPWF